MDTDEYLNSQRSTFNCLNFTTNHTICLAAKERKERKEGLIGQASRLSIQTTDRQDAYPTRPDFEA